METKHDLHDFLTHNEPNLSQSGKPRNFKRLIAVVLIVLILLAGLAFAAFKLTKGKGDGGNKAESFLTNPEAEGSALKAGKSLSNEKCKGEGVVTLTSSPMKKEDIAMVVPYGLMISGHVTPIDHQYFSPANFNSPPDTYEVRALADGRLTEISHRSKTVGDSSKSSNDYRFVFAHSCTFFTYFDLVTSLSPDIKAEFDKNAKTSGSSSFASLDIEVKAGQVVGRIGGQTLDFAVWDTTKPLKGFVSPQLYEGERWKIFTADPLDYYSPDVKELVLSKYLRNDANKSGKIDWDIDGKLIGNWFEQNSNGYQGDRKNPDGKYWRTHLAIAPEHLDPSYYVASFGTFVQPGDGKQFIINSPSIDPKMVDVGSGLVKYDLRDWFYKANGTIWDRKSTAKDIQISPQTKSAGCVLFQMLEDRKLKAEPFAGKTCSAVSGFTANAKIYTR